MKDYDLAIVGGGPAGLAAAISAASEGLKVVILDASTHIGGRPWESNAIENYPVPIGFPDGVTGEKLLSGFVNQAHKFGADFCAPCLVDNIERDGEHVILSTLSYEQHVAKAVILSSGLGPRRLLAKGIGPLMGRGVYYGAPILNGKHREVAVIGGANSAAQAVLRLAQHSKVHMVVRRSIEAGMSAYLVGRIRSHPNVVIHEGVEAAEVLGDDRLSGVLLSDGEELRLDALFVCIGAQPHTRWLESLVALDDKKFILTGEQTCRKDALMFETCIPGVFAAGDVRHGSVKRIAAAIGEGVGAAQSARQYLNH
jgi:thioredoxin reductase (NADPH)